jgi:hypothetical protein
MNHFGHELVSNIELQYRNVESKWKHKEAPLMMKISTP